MLAATLLVALVSTQQTAPVGVPQGEDQPFHVVHLGLDLHLELDTGWVTGEATLRIRNDGATGAAALSVLLNAGLSLRAASRVGGPSLTFQQGPTRFIDLESLDVNHAVVALDQPVAPGATESIRLRYEGRIRSLAHTGMRYIRDSITPAFTILRRDAYSFPLPGLPSIGALRASPSPAFDYEVSVTVPGTHVAATGGRVVAWADRGALRTWRFASAGPAPYLIVTVARYRVVERGGVRIFHFPADSAGAQLVADRVEAALDRLARWFGPLAAPPSFTIMEIPEGFGSQASLTGGIIQTAAAFADRPRLVELYHELSHLWNAPDLDRPSPRWNEGLATFLQYRVAAELDGGDQAAGLDGTVDRLRAALDRDPRLATVPLERFGAEGMTDYSYRVGAVMFGLLCEALGAARFDAAYGRLLRERAAGVTVADLESAFAIDPAAARILDEWLRSTRWVEPVRAGAAFRSLAARYPRGDP